MNCAWEEAASPATCCKCNKRRRHRRRRRVCAQWVRECTHIGIHNTLFGFQLFVCFLATKKRKIKQKKINRNRNFLFFGFDFFSFFGYAASFRLLTFYCATRLPHAACRMHVCISVSMSASVSSTLAASVRYYDWAALCDASVQATKNNNNKKEENQNKCSFCCWCCRSWLPSRRFGVDCAALVCLDSPLPFMRERKIRFK